MSTIAAFIGRVLVALLFVISGIQKIADPGPVAAMLQSVGMSPALTVPVALFEIVLGVALAIGMMTRLVSLVLAGFIVLTILFFHNQFNDPAQTTTILLHVALVGGLLGFFAQSQMRWSYDALRARRTEDELKLQREADARVHEAELRAARAEGRVDVVHTDGVAEPLITPDPAPRRRWF